MKLSNILSLVIKRVAVKFDIPERKVLKILVAHTRHVKAALAEDKPVEVKLDYFGKIIPKEREWKFKEEYDKLSKA